MTRAASIRLVGLIRYVAQPDAPDAVASRVERDGNERLCVGPL